MKDAPVDFEHETNFDPWEHMRATNIIAREIVPGAIWAWSVPIRPGETGDIGACGHWHWHVTLRPPGWVYNPTIFDEASRPKFNEYSRVDTSADCDRL